MSLTQQLIQFLSESPGNIVYHLVVLFSLQVVFALGLSQWRRDGADLFARRLTWAAGGALLLRLGLLLAGMAVYADPTTAVSVLPPLEQAVYAATAVLIVWALLPSPARQPQLSDTIAIILLMVVGMMYIFFAQSWPEQALAGVAYPDSSQAMLWALFQLAVLLTGFALTVAERPLWFSLQQIIIFILLTAQVLHFFSNSGAASQTSADHWTRFGYLLALPLWAVLAYRKNLESWQRPLPVPAQSSAQLPTLLTLSSQVINTLQPEQNARAAIEMAPKILPAATHVALALTQPDNPDRLEVSGNWNAPKARRPLNWLIRLDEWTAFQQALEENSPIELKPDGTGARQLRLWYEEIGLPPAGALLILPLIIEDRRLGLLLLGRANNQSDWPDDEKSAAEALSHYIAQALHNSHAFSQFADQIANTPQTVNPELPLVSGQIITLEEERDRLKAELEVTSIRLMHAETQAAKSARQAHDLADTLAELEKISRDDQIDALEQEIASLSESLIEAEEAMALAAAEQGGISTNWIMTTITRYTSQLEEAQALIQTLEADLMRRERGVTDELVISLAQELRTPMTSITGYTDLLLSEMIGVLGVKQREFLQRVKANVERMDAFLDLIVQLTASEEKLLGSFAETVEVQAVVETAVSTVITQIREKKLRLDLDLPDHLPSLPINRDALQQIVNNLLRNACQASPANGRVTVCAHLSAMPITTDNGHAAGTQFMQLTVQDSGGGIPPEDRARVFDPQHRADSPLIDGLGDTGAGLAVVRTLTEGHGGRVWLESEPGIGSAFSVLFPTAPEQQE
jgi:signal transduction histidine kinase